MDDVNFATVRIVVGVVLAGALGLMFYRPGRSEDEQRPAAVMAAVGFAAGFCFARGIVIACITVASLIAIAFLAPHLIRMFGTSARQTMEEVDIVRGAKRRQRPGLPAKRNEALKKAIRDGVPAETLLELIEWQEEQE